MVYDKKRREVIIIEVRIIGQDRLQTVETQKKWDWSRIIQYRIATNTMIMGYWHSRVRRSLHPDNSIRCYRASLSNTGGKFARTTQETKP